MKRIPTLVGAGLVAAATASAIALGGTAAKTPPERTLTLVEKWIAVDDVYADVPPATSKGAAGEGDSYLFHNDVLDAKGKTKLGTHEARCTYLKGSSKSIGARLICDGLYVLKDGTVSAEAVFTFDPTKPFPFVVTGGSGAYAGARGSGTLTYRSDPNTPFADTVIHLLR